jgi:hypothetical protein
MTSLLLLLLHTSPFSLLCLRLVFSQTKISTTHVSSSNLQTLRYLLAPSLSITNTESDFTIDHNLVGSRA